MVEKHSIYCDDCGREKMAEVRDGKIVIVDRRHGRRHVTIGNYQLGIGSSGWWRSIRYIVMTAVGRRWRRCGMGRL